MNFIPSALRHGIHQPAAGLPKLCFVSAGVHLKFLHDILAELKRNRSPADLLRIERVIVVASIHRVIVEVSGNPVKAHHAKFAVGGRSRR